jgi:glycosyl transferase, family 25
MKTLEKILEGGVYVIHAKKGYELHEKRIINLFKNHNITFEFITDADTSNFYNISLEDYCNPAFISRTRPGTLSCTINHMFALKKMIEKKQSFAIIFENDPFFIGNFEKKINRVIQEAKKLEPGFIISLENTTLKFPAFWQTTKKKVLYRAKRGRCAGAYLIDIAGAEAAIASLQTETCNNVIDWWHNRLVERGILRMYWAHPPLIEQGSHNGLLCSSISSKEKSLKRRLLWNLQKLYKSTFRRIFTRDLIIP